ncbi:MAG: hypothetical protein E7197_00150 [Anaerovibrio sp.]|uniref:hypothetical protein n=1 Tax=Anaerovibrio sp. TaxID=1872532 RepID=UPI0025C4CB02|nr:hypothetical protein [Anaerovibrio sp.]MBE6098440.1 hypothetical protein [Anaerovibrio sp.]
MEDILPIIVFVLLVVVGNVLDKKKPPAKPMPRDWTPPDIKPVPEPEPPQHRPHKPMEYAQVHNPYQEYLTRHISDNKAEKYLEEEPSPYAVETGTRVMSPMAQAIIWSEILAKPKARRHRF